MYRPLAADDAAGCFHGNDDIYKMLKSGANQAGQGGGKKKGYHQLCQCFSVSLYVEIGKWAEQPS